MTHRPIHRQIHRHILAFGFATALGALSPASAAQDQTRLESAVKQLEAKLDEIDRSLSTLESKNSKPATVEPARPGGPADATVTTPDSADQAELQQRLADQAQKARSLELQLTELNKALLARETSLAAAEKRATDLADLLRRADSTRGPNGRSDDRGKGATTNVRTFLDQAQVHAQQKDARLEELARTEQELRKALAAKEAELQVAATQQLELNRTLQQRESDTQSARAALETLQQQAGAQQQALASKDQELGQMQLQTAQRAAEVDQLRAQISALQQEAVTARDVKQALAAKDQQLAQAQAQQATLEQTVQTLQKQQGELQQEIAVRDQRMAQASLRDAHTDQLRAQLDTLRHEAEAARQSSVQALTVKDAQLADVQREYAMLTEAHRALEQQQAELRQGLSVREQQLGQIAAQHEAETARLRGQLDTLRQEAVAARESAGQALAAKDDQLAQAQREHAALATSLSTLEQQQAELRQGLDTRHQELAVTAAQREAEAQQLRAQLDALRQEAAAAHDSSQQALALKTEQLALARQERAELEQSQQAMARDLAELRRDAAEPPQASAEVADLRQQLAEMATERNALRQRVEALHHQGGAPTTENIENVLPVEGGIQFPNNSGTVILQLGDGQIRIESAPPVPAPGAGGGQPVRELRTGPVMEVLRAPRPTRQGEDKPKAPEPPATKLH